MNVNFELDEDSIQSMIKEALAEAVSVKVKAAVNFAVNRYDFESQVKFLVKAESTRTLEEVCSEVLSRKSLIQEKVELALANRLKAQLDKVLKQSEKEQA